MSISPLLGDPFVPVFEVMRKHGGRGTPTQFHEAVNVTFHRFESEQYDRLHQDMWQSLPRQMMLIVGDCLGDGSVPERINMLDIGCGTGLATDCLLRTQLAGRVQSVDLLDTCPAMLARAAARRKTWAKPGDNIEGPVESLSRRKTYDLIVASSVLHHIPDVKSFLRTVMSLQDAANPGALFLHMQDPNGDFLDDPARRERMGAERRNLPEWLARLAPRRVSARMLREIRGEQGRDYLSMTNRELVKQGWISSPLTTEEIFAITDIHVRRGSGISVKQLRVWLPDYQLLSHRSYGFFGVLWSDLPPQQRAAEEKLITEGALTGKFVSAAWRRRIRSRGFK